MKANVKFNQGFLFCLPDGLAFVDRPALWLPFDDVSDLKLARAEGVGSSFDVIVSLEPEKDGADGDRSPSRAGESFEFANISRDELDGVRRYLAKTCSEAGDGARVGGEGAEDDSARADSDDDDSDDEDFDVGVDVNEEDEEEEEESDDDDEEEDDSDDSDADGDAREEQSPNGDSADGAGRKRARDPQREIPELRRGASSELAADVSELGSEEEEEDDSDEDGAFEVVPVAKTARR